VRRFAKDGPDRRPTPARQASACWDIARGEFTRDVADRLLLVHERVEDLSQAFGIVFPVLPAVVLEYRREIGPGDISDTNMADLIMWWS